MTALPAAHDNPVPATLAGKLRPVGVLLSVACVAAAVYAYRILGRRVEPWCLLGAALALSFLWQRGLELHGSAEPAPPSPAGPRRRLAGALIAACGAALFAWASVVLHRNWAGNFDVAWVAWVAATVLLSVGLDLESGRWGRPRRTASPWLRYFLVAMLVVALIYRLGSLVWFPGFSHITQIEELQAGAFGQDYLDGIRGRWEFLSHMWLAAAGIHFGGPTLPAMRVPYALVGALKVIPLFLWLRWATGTLGAVTGTALFVCSFWDVMLSRIPAHQTTLLMALVFALLAGPARRGRPSAYVWLGFAAGFVVYDYVAFRPLLAFALIGAAWMSWRDVSANWVRRLGRPLLTLLITVSMTLPLFGRLRGQAFWNEYFNGWNRAHAQEQYYNPRDTWKQAFGKRIERSFDAAGLFLFAGDANPVHNIGGRPLVDPVSATLMLFGAAYCLTHLLRGVFGLTLAAFGVTLAGTMVATGNWDVLRASALVAYVYGLAGYGAAAIAAALERSWRRSGQAVALVMLTAGIVAAACLDTRTLVQFVTSPAVRRAEFSPLAYLSSQLRQHVRAGERVEGIAPFHAYALGLNDSYWLRGKQPMPGTLGPDVETMLRDWSAHPGPALVLVYAGPATRDLTTYLESVAPGLNLHVESDPSGPAFSIAYAHVSGPPPELTARLAEWRCAGIASEFTFIGSRPEDVLARVSATVPFIDSSTWPVATQRTLAALEPRVRRIRTKLRGSFSVQTPGTYAFFLETAAGQAQVLIDGRPLDASGTVPFQLDPGPHTLEITGDFAPIVDSTMRLAWRGPDSGDQRELMPLYKLHAMPLGTEAAERDCSPGASATSPAAPEGAR